MNRFSVVRKITFYPDDLNMSDELKSAIDLLLLTLEDDKIEFDYKTTITESSVFTEENINEEH